MPLWETAKSNIAWIYMFSFRKRLYSSILKKMCSLNFYVLLFCHVLHDNLLHKQTSTFLCWSCITKLQLSRVLLCNCSKIITYYKNMLSLLRIFYCLEIHTHIYRCNYLRKSFANKTMLNILEVQPINYG